MKLFLFAGEQSGDNLGGSLLAALHRKNPDLQTFGVGGPSMRKQNLYIIQDMEDFQVMGYSDILLALPRLWRAFHELKKMILKRNPSGVVLIDYPGFNLRMAKALRKSGYKGKLIHYVAPTIWAHSPKRKNSLVDTLDLLLTIFPFESDYFVDTPLRTLYVGDPLLEMISLHNYDAQWRKHHNINHDHPIIGIFPGSRPGEIKRNLEVLLKSASLLQAQNQNPRAVVVISIARESLSEQIAEKARELGLEVVLCDSNQNYDLMANCHIALATSGTITRELAFHKIPTVVVYRPSVATAFVAKFILHMRLKHISIINISLHDAIFPEFVHLQISPKQVAAAAQTLYEDNAARTYCLQGCEEFRKLSGNKQSSTDAAQAILELLHGQ